MNMNDASHAKADRSAARFSVRGMFLLVALAAAALGGYVNYGAMGVWVVAAVTSVAALVWSLRRRRPRTATVAGITALPTVLVATVLVLRWLVLGIGPVDPSDYPPFDFMGMVDLVGVSVDDAEIECLESYLHEAYVWRTTVDGTAVETITAEYGLQEVKEGNLPAGFWRAFPWRWRPEAKPGQRYYSTMKAAHREGDFYDAMYDPEKRWLYVWYRYRFT